MSLVEHLDELRTRIIRSLIVLGVAWCVAWFVHDPLYVLLTRQAEIGLPPQIKANYSEAFRSITDAFMLKLKLSFYLGLVVALPYIILQVYGFIAPGLKQNEKKPLQIVGPLSVFLFALGCFFCWLIIPTTMNWFASIALESFEGTKIIQEPGTLVFFIVNMMFAFGIGFQLPLVVYFLAKIGLLPVDSLNKSWRHAVVVIFILAAVLTPSNDPISMLTMAIPLCILFVISVVAVKHTAKIESREQDELVEGEV